ncbi:hypothetical protein NPIL_692011 [Nephila pilipes]|uniref:Uncharacterized protein n=1 Tax=Nephila pilipes TaxID=299642 RepID=A0A8X6P197_NEPPI|nr:hypothetical protein NPIL_692011 [Nephila pilipes]
MNDRPVESEGEKKKDVRETNSSGNCPSLLTCLGYDSSQKILPPPLRSGRGVRQLLEILFLIRNEEFSAPKNTKKTCRRTSDLCTLLPVYFSHVWEVTLAQMKLAGFIVN